MNFAFAEVSSAEQTPLEGNIGGPRVAVWRDGNVISFSLREGCGPFLQLGDVRAVMSCIAKGTAGANNSLLWRISSVAIKCSAIDGILARWDETGEPPLMSFIGIDLGAHRHTTCGLAAFIGYEIAADFRDARQARHAARNLARLARYALTHRGLSRDEAYEATDGTMLDLVWPLEVPIELVTIVFQSVQNGSSSD